jgi:hypothetical protein
MHTIFWLENLKGRDNSEYLTIDGKTIQNGSQGNRVGRCGLDASGSRYGSGADSCEHSSETSGSIQGREFLD